MAKTERMGQYYELELFVCGVSYLHETIVYDPKNQIFENTGDSSGDNECLFKLDE